MAGGVAVDDDGRHRTLTLRTAQRFHDGTPALARECVASLRRWGARDAFGKTLFAVTDALLAADDRRLVFRLTRPYPMLPKALSKTGPMMAAIMPERLASADSMRLLPELIGSGPYRDRVAVPHQRDRMPAATPRRPAMSKTMAVSP